MKKQSFYLCLLVLLLSFMAQTDAYAQNDCTILEPPNCTTSISVDLTASNGIITVDDDFVADFLSNADANTHVHLVIPAGDHTAASFEDLNFCRTTIRVANSGEATFAGYSIDNPPLRGNTIDILNCHNLELDGHNIKVLDAYGTGVLYGSNDQAVFIGKASSCINIHHLDIQNPSGFAGIMAKDSPGCEKGLPIDIADANAPFMHHIYIHHNYIHNIRQGEGIYAGDTAFMTGRETGCGKYYPQKIENVWIYNNFIEQIGLDAIQLGSCIAGGRIYENFCVDYGTLGDGGMSNGIQIGLGNIGTICERNFIRQPAERSENAGHGILCQAAGNTVSEIISFTVL